MHTSGNSSIDTSLIRDIYSGPEVLFETWSPRNSWIMMMMIMMIVIKVLFQTKV